MPCTNDIGKKGGEACEGKGSDGENCRRSEGGRDKNCTRYVLKVAFWEVVLLLPYVADLIISLRLDDCLAYDIPALLRPLAMNEVGTSVLASPKVGFEVSTRFLA